MSLNIDISIDGLLNLIRRVAPEMERPLQHFILWSALALFLVPWIVLFFLIESLATMVVGERTTTATLPEYAGGIAIFVIMAMVFIAAMVYKAKHNNEKRKNEAMIEKMNAALESDDFDQNPHRVLEEILGDDRDM